MAYRPNIPAPVSIDRTEIEREHGAYVFDDDKVTIISQPTVEHTLASVAAQPDSNSLVVTPELSLLDDHELADFSSERQRSDEMIRLLTERFDALKDISKTTTNTIMMGAPVLSSRGSFNNGVIVAEEGEIIHTQRKVYPSPQEEMLGWFEYSDAPHRYQRLGRAVLICSELPYASKLSPLERVMADTLLVPAAWGIPSMSPEAYARHGGRDGYHQYTLDSAVRMAAEEMPRLKQVYVADRSIAGSVPQIGRLTIER